MEIEAFRNITNKQTMAVDPEVTCLIGKNESGKTTVLKALHRLNPANNADGFHVTTDYPRRDLSRHKRMKDLDTVGPVTAVFKLEDADFDAIEALLDVRPPAKAYVKASRLYDGSLRVNVHCDLEDVLADVFEEAGVDEEDDQKAITGDHTTIEAVSAAAKARAKEVGAGKKTGRVKAIEKVPAELARRERYVEGTLDDDEQDQLIQLLPKFFYFSNYEIPRRLRPPLTRRTRENPAVGAGGRDHDVPAPTRRRGTGRLPGRGLRQPQGGAPGRQPGPERPGIRVLEAERGPHSRLRHRSDSHAAERQRPAAAAPPDAQDRAT
ncbi:AAA family ATPase [Streptomyces sp. NPDC055793]